MTQAQAPMPVEERLVYREELFSGGFGAYQWVSIKLFELPAETLSDHQALGLLLRHVRYRDSYATTKWKDAVSIHGPYRLKTISTDCFHRVDPGTAEREFRAWAEEYRPLKDDIRNWFGHTLYPLIRTATCRFRLTGLGKESWHEWGDVVGKTGFHEVVLIDRAAKSLALVVGADD